MKSPFATVQNAVAIPAAHIPVLTTDAWRQAILDHGLGEQARIVALFGTRGTGTGTRVYAVLGLDAQKLLVIGATDFPATDATYESLTPQLPQAHLFERELFEEYGIRPTGHQWLKPVRNPGPYPFYTVEGEGIHEVAVGPVHAGIIEPGHFRFQCHGETVLHLEIRLGYQHRGVESLMVRT
ncbi:MAG: NADH-quinone oxidoreductase subunit C, partial [Deltaproteobacteria bacterium]|nr:NADH-quinone oxidoreductase subunit C [Deltaproteobacteria bacterium]